MKSRWNSVKGFTIGELVVVFAIVLLVALILTPFMRHARAKTDKVMCMNNVRELGQALYVYASENDQKFPVSLKTLYDEQYVAEAALVDCPASSKVGTPDDPDYIYTAGMTVKSPSSTQLLRDKAQNHPSGGMNVMYVNGAVEWKE